MSKIGKLRKELRILFAQLDDIIEEIGEAKAKCLSCDLLVEKMTKIRQEIIEVQKKIPSNGFSWQQDGGLL